MSLCYSCFFFFKQKTAYEMRISDWSSDVCSSDLSVRRSAAPIAAAGGARSAKRPGGKEDGGRGSGAAARSGQGAGGKRCVPEIQSQLWRDHAAGPARADRDRKSTRLNSSH